MVFHTFALTKELYDKYYNQNIWISVLRIFMCFVVIHNHFGTTGITFAQRFISFFDSLAVPSFFFLSFFLLAEKVKNYQTDPDTIKKRLKRLWLPIIFWNCFCFCYWNSLYLVTGNHSKIIGFDSLMKALLFTHVQELTTTPLWFLYAQSINFILLVIFFLYVEKKNNRIIGLLIIMLFAFILEYSGVLFSLFSASSTEVKYSIGRTFECIPFMSSAIILGWLNNQLPARKAILIVILSICAVLSYFFVPSPEGFGYGGIYKCIAAILICTITLSLPDVLRGRVRFFLNYIGSCTLGIYCMHVLVGNSLGAFHSYLPFSTESLYYDMLIFIVGLTMTLFFRFVIKKFKLHYLSGVV